MGGEIFLAEKRKRSGNKSNVEPEATICMCPSPPLPLPHHSNVSLTLSLSSPLTKNSSLRYKLIVHLFIKEYNFVESITPV